MLKASQHNYPHLRFGLRALMNPNCKLSLSARMVGVFLMDHMSDSYDGAYPSVTTMADYLGLDRTTVMKATEELLKDGLFVRTPAPVGRGVHAYAVADLEKLMERIGDFNAARKAVERARRRAEKAVERSENPTGTGRKSRPAENSDRSENPTPTGRKIRLVPVGNSDTNLHHRSDHRSDPLQQEGDSEGRSSAAAKDPSRVQAEVPSSSPTPGVPAPAQVGAATYGTGSIGNWNGSTDLYLDRLVKLVGGIITDRRPYWLKLNDAVHEAGEQRLEAAIIEMEQVLARGAKLRAPADRSLKGWASRMSADHAAKVIADRKKLEEVKAKPRWYSTTFTGDF